MGQVMVCQYTDETQELNKTNSNRADATTARRSDQHEDTESVTYYDRSTTSPNWSEPEPDASKSKKGKSVAKKSLFGCFSTVAVSDCPDEKILSSVRKTISGGYPRVDCTTPALAPRHPRTLGTRAMSQHTETFPNDHFSTAAEDRAMSQHTDTFPEDNFSTAAEENQLEDLPPFPSEPCICPSSPCCDAPPLSLPPRPYHFSGPLIPPEPSKECMCLRFIDVLWQANLKGETDNFLVIGESPVEG